MIIRSMSSARSVLCSHRALTESKSAGEVVITISWA